MIISERIFCVMEQKNITQLELSRRTGIATSNISDWKKKKTMLQNLMETQRITETEARKMLGI